jgi:hypothetical protein
VTHSIKLRSLVIVLRRGGTKQTFVWISYTVGGFHKANYALHLKFDIMHLRSMF